MVDGDEWKRLGIAISSDGLADFDVLDSCGDSDDTSRAATFRVGGGEARVGEGLHDLGLSLGAVLAKEENGITFFDVAAKDLADGDAADVFVPLDVRNEHEERGIRICLGGGDVFDDFLEERDAVFALVIGMIHEISVTS